MSLFKNEIIATPQIIGYVDGSAAPAGQIGEHILSILAVGSSVSITTATPKNVLSISLTAGDWNVDGNVNFTAAAATTAAGALWTAGINATSATIPTDGTEVPILVPAETTATYLNSITIPKKRISLTTTTTVYLVAEATFTAGTVGGYGKLSARRVR